MKKLSPTIIALIVFLLAYTTSAVDMDASEQAPVKTATGPGDAPASTAPPRGRTIINTNTSGASKRLINANRPNEIRSLLIPWVFYGHRFRNRESPRDSRCGNHRRGFGEDQRGHEHHVPPSPQRAPAKVWFHNTVQEFPIWLQLWSIRQGL